MAPMFEIDDVIIYGAQGVCKIADIEEKAVAGVKKKYFILKPINDKGATIFAPTDYEHVLRKMRRLLSENESNALIDSMPDEDTIWIANDNARKELFKSIILKGDHLELIRMIKTIYAYKKERESQGKRLHMSDEHFLKDGEQILYNEFQYVLKLSDKKI